MLFPSRPFNLGGGVYSARRNLVVTLLIALLTEIAATTLKNKNPRYDLYHKRIIMRTSNSLLTLLGLF